MIGVLGGFYWGRVEEHFAAFAFCFCLLLVLSSQCVRGKFVSCIASNTTSASWLYAKIDAFVNGYVVYLVLLCPITTDAI